MHRDKGASLKVKLRNNFVSKFCERYFGSIAKNQNTVSPTHCESNGPNVFRFMSQTVWWTCAKANHSINTL